MTRPPSSDEPSREVFHHMQRIRWRRAAGLYVTSDGGLSQAAYVPAPGTAELGSRHIAEREAAKDLWRIDVSGLPYSISLLVSAFYTTVPGAGTGLAGIPWGTFGLNGNTDDAQPITYGPEVSKVAHGLDLSPTYNWVVQAQGFYNQAGVPVFSVFPVTKDSIGTPVDAPIVNDWNGSASTIAGARAQFSPDGNWILASVYSPTSPVGSPPYKYLPAAVAFPWNDDGTLGSPVDAPTGTIVFMSAGGGSQSVEWHPSGDYVIIGSYYVVEWTGSGFGSVIGLVPGLLEADIDSTAFYNFARWSRSGGALVYGKFSFTDRQLKGVVWSGSGYGSAHANYTTLPQNYVPVDIVWSLDNTRAAILWGSGSSVILESYEWSDATGFGAKLDSTDDHLAPPDNPYFNAGGATAIDLSPNGEWIAVAPGDGFLPTRVIQWKSDGTFGALYRRFSEATGLRLGVQWWPPGVTNYPPA